MPRCEKEMEKGRGMENEDEAIQSFDLINELEFFPPPANCIYQIHFLYITGYQLITVHALTHSSLKLDASSSGLQLLRYIVK